MDESNTSFDKGLSLLSVLSFTDVMASCGKIKNLEDKTLGDLIKIYE